MALTHNQYAVAAISATLILAGFYTIIGAGLATVSGWEDGSADIETLETDIHIEGKDTDGDGLSDSKELTLNTNPSVADTDGDGLNDGAEIIENTNPLLVDTDSDGYTDNQEYITGSNPLDSTLTPPYLVAYFDFEGSTDAERLLDKSAWGNDAVIKLKEGPWINYNSPTFVNGGGATLGTNGSSIRMNDSVLDIPNLNFTLGDNDSYTMTAWVKDYNLGNSGNRAAGIFSQSNKGIFNGIDESKMYTNREGGWGDSFRGQTDLSTYDSGSLDSDDDNNSNAKTTIVYQNGTYLPITGGRYSVVEGPGLQNIDIAQSGETTKPTNFFY